MQYVNTVKLSCLNRKFLELKGDLVCAGNVFSKAARSGPIDAKIYLEITQEFEDTVAKLQIDIQDPGAKNRLMRTRACFVDFLRNSYPVDGKHHEELVFAVSNERLKLLKDNRVEQAKLVISPPKPFCICEFYDEMRPVNFVMFILLSGQMVLMAGWLTLLVVAIVIKTVRPEWLD